MAITAKNYAAQAQRGMEDYVKLLPDNYVYDSAIIKAQSDLITKAVKFAMPDYGCILDDNFRGLEGLPVRLPFPLITIEYFVPSARGGMETDIHSPKRLIIASEVNAEFFERIGIKLPNVSEKWIYIYYTCFVDKLGWVPGLAGWAMPCDWQSKPTVKKERIIDCLPNERNRPVLQGIPCFLPSFYKDSVEKHGETVTQNNLIRDVVGEVSAVMELCEALSCSNITHEPIEEVNQNTNAKRIRQGKLPLYETRILVINAGQKNTESGDATGTHASPRQHLRRGHIRKLPKENIWINSCVVGSAKNGIIDKSYDVKA